MKTVEEYLDEYISLVEVARNRPTPEGYTEKHHIFPLSWMPNDYLVVLTAQEHFTAHYLLHKAFPEDQPMAFAFWAMCNMKKVDRDYKVKAEIYAEARKAFAKANSILHSGREFSAEHKARLKIANTGSNHPMFGKSLLKKTKAKLSAANTGSKNPMFGKKAKTSNCPHCGRDIAVNLFNRFHNDNCKLK